MPVETTVGRVRPPGARGDWDHDAEVLRGLREHPAGGGEAEIDGDGRHGGGLLARVLNMRSYDKALGARGRTQGPDERTRVDAVDRAGDG